MTVSIIQKDMIWHSDHHQQAIRELMVLQQQLFYQRLKETSIAEKSKQ